MPKMKLYVWEDVLNDYSSGMVVILAHSLEEAYATFAKELSYELRDLQNSKPHVYDVDRKNPVCHYVYGGG